LQTLTTGNNPLKINEKHRMTNAFYDVGSQCPRYLNVRLKKCAFPGADENNKKWLHARGDATRGNAPKFVRFNGNPLMRL